MSDRPAERSDARFSAAYDYALPTELIAQAPAAVRDESRLLVLDGPEPRHLHFHDVPACLRPGDLLVLNETRVIAARLFGERTPGGGRAELLLLHPSGGLRYDPSATRWTALARPARRLRPGTRISFGELGEGRVVGALGEGLREIDFELRVPFEAFLATAGRMPLPPYIRQPSPDAQSRYQTVFARVPGSVAAPTASLHFTPALLQRLADGGVEIAKLTLDVGLGTFRPVTAERIDRHVMHAEAYAIPPETAQAVERARHEGRRVIAAGTTVTRALEASWLAGGRVAPGEAMTDLFIVPGFSFHVVDAMITNFHLPRSTLLMLVSAFAGRERVLRAYEQAVERRYRFYSFGDAMLLWRLAPG